LTFALPAASVPLVQLISPPSLLPFKSSHVVFSVSSSSSLIRFYLVSLLVCQGSFSAISSAIAGFSVDFSSPSADHAAVSVLIEDVSANVPSVMVRSQVSILSTLFLCLFLFVHCSSNFSVANVV
jgi:hypothetical protein